MNKRLIGFCLIISLLFGQLYAQHSYRYAKAKAYRKQSPFSLKSIRVYDDIEGQSLFLRHLPTIESSETWDIYDDPGGSIQFFSKTDSLFGVITLGQTKAEVWQQSDSTPGQESWTLVSPGDTTYLQRSTSSSREMGTQQMFRLFKRIDPKGIPSQTSEGQIEIDLIYFSYKPGKRPLVRIDVQDSLDDYPRIFPIMALVIVFKSCFTK